MASFAPVTNLSYYDIGNAIENYQEVFYALDSQGLYSQLVTLDSGVLATQDLTPIDKQDFVTSTKQIYRMQPPAWVLALDGTEANGTWCAVSDIEGTYEHVAFVIHYHENQPYAYGTSSAVWQHAEQLPAETQTALNTAISAL